jgi:hypothetical protein
VVTLEALGVWMLKPTEVALPQQIMGWFWKHIGITSLDSSIGLVDIPMMFSSSHNVATKQDIIAN